MPTTRITIHIDLVLFAPKLQTVEALAPYRLRTTWSTGEVLDVDVSAQYSWACLMSDC